MLVFLLLVVTCILLYQIKKYYGLFEHNKRTSITANEITDRQKYNKRLKKETQRLNKYARTTEIFKNLVFRGNVQRKHEYYIQRLDIRSKITGNLYTPEELRGKYVYNVLRSGVLLFPVAVVNLFVSVGLLNFIKLVLLLFFAVNCIIALGYQTAYNLEIAKADEIIDNNFLNLYLLIYPKLRLGSRGSLKATLNTYISTLEQNYMLEDKEVMIRFTKDFLSQVTTYGDGPRGLAQLKELYRSATIINFCNVASQALEGIDNIDNLITFKLRLTERRTNLMRKRQQALISRANIAIHAVWVILFILIGLTWYTMLPRGAFKMFGL